MPSSGVRRAFQRSVGEAIGARNVDTILSMVCFEFALQDVHEMGTGNLACWQSQVSVGKKKADCRGSGHTHCGEEGLKRPCLGGRSNRKWRGKYPCGGTWMRGSSGEFLRRWIPLELRYQAHHRGSSSVGNEEGGNYLGSVEITVVQFGLNGIG